MLASPTSLPVRLEACLRNASSRLSWQPLSFGMSPVVKVFGCRHHDGGAAHTGAGVRKPPMEETAGGVARWPVRRYGDLAAVVPECRHNFCDMARTLRMGENTFRRPCDFKELRVVKRAHIATCALCALFTTRDRKSTRL